MHVKLTDVLTCPRCGPEYGLILLADQVEDRRVIAGWLGCANCRERYRVERGFTDLRSDPGDSHDEASISKSSEDALRLAALLGVTEGPALVLVAGSGAGHAHVIADLVPGLEVIAAWGPLAAEAERPGVSRVAVAGTLPMRSASMRGVALTDAASQNLLEEAARVAAPRARVVVLSAAADVAHRLEQCGLRVIASDERATVAARPAF